MAVETVNPCRSESLNAFPFDQNHLYLASQPGGYQPVVTAIGAAMLL